MRREVCTLCGIAYAIHDRDDQPGPLGLRQWVCWLTEERYQEVLDFVDCQEYV